MGDLYQPIIPEPSSHPKRKKNFFLLGLAFAVITCALAWRDVVEYVNGEARLTAKYQEKLDKKMNEPDKAEQYALVANINGNYACLHSGRAVFFLKAGEVWKYGVTSNGERGRYTTEFLQNNNVSYKIQFRGTMKDCLREEQKRLYQYPILPENLAREEVNRLIRPPYNPIMR